MNNIAVGTINYATNSGLGILVKDFWENGIINKILVVKHRKLENYNKERYPNSHTISVNEESEKIEILENFIKNLDVLFLFETPFFKETIPLAKKHGIKTILMPMYECTPHNVQADLLLCPSLLDLEIYKKRQPNIKKVFLPVPVNSNIKWRLRKKAKTFFHNAGNGSRNDRNGTKCLIESMKYVQSPIKLKIRTQTEDYDFEDSRIEYVKKNLSFQELWQAGDVFVFPERWNGLSLPLQEAFSSGCLVMAGNRFPINTWLPSQPLIDVDSSQTIMVECHLIQAEKFAPKDIAKKIDEWYDKDIEEFSLLGKQFYEQNSWDVLKQKYKECIMSLQ